MFTFEKAPNLSKFTDGGFEHLAQHFGFVALFCFLRCARFAFLNREDTKNIQQAVNAAKYAEKTEASKIPRGAQVRRSMYAQQRIPNAPFLRKVLVELFTGQYVWC